MFEVPIDSNGSIKINYHWCKSCGICVEFCPTGVLALGDKGQVEVVNPEACVGCEACEYRCPDFAIIVERTGEDE